MKEDNCCGHTHHHSQSHQSENTDSTTSQTTNIPEGYQKSQFYVRGMDCADEISAVHKTVRHSMIHSVYCNLIASSITVIHHKDFPQNTMISLIQKTGLQVVKTDSSTKASPYFRQACLIAASGLCLLLGLIVEWFFNPTSLQSVKVFLFLISMIVAGLLIFPKAFRAVKNLQLDMNVLMTVASLGAVFISEYAEAAAIVFLFSLAELLEALSISRSRRAIQSLMKLSPDKAFVKNQNGVFLSTEAINVKVGDIFQVKPGERIPLDGRIVHGHSFVNESALTGESTPCSKSKNDSVFSGTLNESGVLEIEALKISMDSKASQIIHLVEEAQKQKAPSQKFVDQFARYYTPIVFICALLVAFLPPTVLSISSDIVSANVWSDWFYKGLVLLVIACPCALVLSTPVAIVSGLTALARQGVLVKGGSFLETLGKLKALALDKTGTLTQGQPDIQSLKIFNTMNEDEILSIAASLAALSTHPLSKAISRHASIKNLSLSSIENFVNHSGQGVEGQIHEHIYFLSNHKMAHELGICSPLIEQDLQKLEQENYSVVVVGHKPHSNCHGEIIALIGLADQIRPTAADAIRKLFQAGLENIVLLSGDQPLITEKVAHAVGVSTYYGALMPEHKVEKIRSLAKHHSFVGMVGDGINDAPAMAEASLGISMGDIGTDIAIETSDVVLMNDDLGQLSVAIRQGRRTLNIIYFNIVMALLAKFIFLILTFSGHASMWMAVAADTGVSLFVIVNALRLLKVDYEEII